MGSQADRLWQQYSGIPQQPMTSRADSLYNDLLSTDPYNEDEAGEPESFWKYLGGLGKYGYNLIFNNPYVERYGIVKAPFQMAATGAEGLIQVGKNVGRTFAGAASLLSPYHKTPIKEMTKEIWRGFSSSVEGVIDKPGSLPKGILEMTAEPLLETFSGTTKVGDTPVISTPTERAKAIQETAAIATMGIGYTSTARALATKLAPIGEKALLEQGFMKNMGKALLTGATASGVAGAAGIATSEVGDDDLFVKVVSGALAGIPLGIVTAPLFEMGRVKNINLEAYGSAVKKYRTDRLNALEQEWSAMYGLASSENSTLQTLVNNIDSFASAEGQVEAIVRSSVNNKQGWIIPSATEETITKALSGVSKEATGGPPLEWLEAPRAVKISNPTYLGMKIEWASNFDKAAYIVSNLKSKAKSYPQIVKEITTKFGVSFDDVVAHGKYVRQSIKNMIAGGKIERLTQPEIDMFNRAIERRGEALVGKMAEGTQQIDYNGVVWTRVGNTLTDGKLVYPVNDKSLLMTLGRDPKKFDPLSGKIKLPALEFRPDFHRAVGDFKLYKHYTGPDKFDLLISPLKLAANHAKFYEQTGFLPGEMVALDGFSHARILQRGSKPNTFLVATVKGDKGVRVVKADRLQHHPDGIKSAVDGLEAFEATSEGMFNKFFDTFKKDFNENLIKVEGQQSFDNIFERARLKHGIDESQKAGLKLATYRRLQDDFIDQLPESERIPLKTIRGQLELHEEIMMSNKTDQIHAYATGNGLYIRNKGGGAFELRQAADDKLIHTFGSLDEGLELLNKMGKNPYHSIDLDGGTPLPSAVAELGGATEEWNPKSNNWNKILDRVQVGWYSRLFTSSQELFHSWASIWDDTYKTNNYFKNRIAEWYKNNQVASQALRRFHEYNSKAIAASYLKFKNAIRGMNKDQLELMLGYIETMSPEEIRTKLLGRPASTIEIRKAIEWSNTASKNGFSVFDIEDLYHAAEKAGKGGTPEFESAINGYIKNGVEKNGKIVKADPNVGNIVIDLGRLNASTLVGQEPFAKYLTLKLMDAYQHPDLALTRAQYLTKHKIDPSGPIRVAADIFEETMEQITDLAGIPKSERVNAHVPSIRLMKEVNSWADVKMPDELMIRLSSAVIGDNRTMIRDPMTLLHKYIEEVGRHKTVIEINGEQMTYNQFINKATAEIDRIGTELNTYEMQAGKGTANSGKIFQKAASRHLEEIQGRADETTLTRTWMKTFYKKLGYSDRASSDMTDIIAAATQGANQVMWIRDVVSAGGIAYSLFGHEFAGKAIFTPVPKHIIESLEKRGKIPIVGASDLASPQAVRMSEDLSSKVSKMADVALTLSGQHHIYRHRLAGIYLATEDLVNKWIPKLQRREISKKMFMDNIMIDVHPKAVQTLFDKYISSGDFQAAIDYLATQNSKRIMNLFGYANTPIGWTTSAGRLLGQYGSWGSNYIATVLNSSRNLSSAAGAKRMLRLSSFEGARILTGAATGLNLTSFSLNPFMNIPGVGPIADITDEMQRIGRTVASGDVGSAIRFGMNTIPGVNVTPDWDMNFTTDIGRLLVPYSYASENLLKSIIDLPQEGYTPFQSLMKGIGFRPVPP